MSKMKWAATAATALMLAGCARDEGGEADRLMETSREWSRVTATGDVDRIVSYWTDDAVIVPPGQPEVRGKRAIRAYIEQSLKIPGFKVAWEPLEAHLSASGDMGYLIERTLVTMNDAAGRPATQSYRAVTVWRRQPDGAWKNVLDMTSEAPRQAR